MSINGIGVGYSAWQETEKVQKNGSRTGFANKMAGADMAGSVLPQRAGVRVTGQNSALEAYRASAASTVRTGLCRTMRLAALTSTISRENG